MSDQPLRNDLPQDPKSKAEIWADYYSTIRDFFQELRRSNPLLTKTHLLTILDEFEDHLKFQEVPYIANHEEDTFPYICHRVYSKLIEFRHTENERHEVKEHVDNFDLLPVEQLIRIVDVDLPNYFIEKTNPATVISWDPIQPKLSTETNSEKPKLIQIEELVYSRFDETMTLMINKDLAIAFTQQGLDLILQDFIKNIVRTWISQFPNNPSDLINLINITYDSLAFVLESNSYPQHKIEIIRIMITNDISPDISVNVLWALRTGKRYTVSTIKRLPKVEVQKNAEVEIDKMFSHYISQCAMKPKHEILLRNLAERIKKHYLEVRPKLYTTHEYRYWALIKNVLKELNDFLNKLSILLSLQDGNSPLAQTLVNEIDIYSFGRKFSAEIEG